MAKAKFLRFYQLSNGYAYNSDSLFLVDFAKAYLKPRMQILDLGSGCGIIGLLCERHFNVCATLLEIDKNTSFLSSINAKTNGLDSRIFCADFLDSSVNADKLGKFDYIVSNPPFYRKGALISKNQLLAQARSSSFLPAKEWIKRTKHFLKPKGGIIFCYRPCDLGLIFVVLKENGFNCETLRLVYPFASREASLVLLYARLDSRTPLKILPPLFTHNSTLQTDFSNEAKAIYEKYQTYSIKVHSDFIENLYPL